MYESGTWTTEWAKESSNFREADNLVTKIETLVREGKIHGQEVFLFTDNSTFEFTFYRGYSTSWKLSAIILRLYQAMRDGDLILHVIHVAGTRMKEWGVDGLSRGDLLEGMMSGLDPLLFIPLSEGANERSSGKVEDWVRSWWMELEGKIPWGNLPLTVVTKDNLFDLHKVEGPRLWMPPRQRWRQSWRCSTRTGWLIQ